MRNGESEIVCWLIILWQGGPFALLPNTKLYNGNPLLLEVSSLTSMDHYKGTQLREAISFGIGEGQCLEQVHFDMGMRRS